MIRLSVFGLLAAIIVCICSISPAAAATTPQAPALVQPVSAPAALAPDPFLSQATVTTSIVESFPCPCTISSGCPSVGFDCADPPGCCHCSGPDPAHLKCVANAH